MIHLLLENLTRVPNRARALREYVGLASGYDQTTGRVARIRDEAIASLQLQPGESVLDVACGTGGALIALASAVCPGGRVVGVEQSPEMAAIAKGKVDSARGAHGVEIIVQSMETLELDERFDAILMVFTHDVLQNPEAVKRVIAHARPGSRIAVAGLQFLPWWWAAPINLINAYRARRYLTTFRGLRTPWRSLQNWVPDLTVEQTYFLGSCYRALGTVAGESRETRKGD